MSKTKMQLVLNNKPVKVWAQVVIKFAQKIMKVKKHPCCIDLCAFRSLIKASCLKPFSDSNFEVKNYLLL